MAQISKTLFAQDNPIAADDHLDKLEQEFLHLRNFPETGASKQELKSQWPERKIRLWPVDDYIVVYEIRDHDIQILRVFNAAVDFTRLKNTLSFN